MVNAIYLPQPSQKGNVPFEEAIARRRSIRHFTPEPVSLPQLSHLLWAARGIAGTGATYPIEVFVVYGGYGIKGVDAGIYNYHVDDRSLILQHKGDIRRDLARVGLDQESIYQAPVNIVICALYEQTLRSYGNRGEMYVHMEVGHAGQNI